MKPYPHPIFAQPSQRGSILVSAVFAILICLAVLMSAQIGYLYYMKRELQKAADLSALSAVQVLAPTGSAADCAPGASVFLAARASASENGQSFMDAVTPADVTVRCVVWDPKRTQADGSHVFEPGPGERVNAVQVRIDKSLSSLFPSVISGWMGGAQASVVATAASTDPIAAFSVGSRLLRLGSNGLVGKLLASLGATPQQLTVLDSAGLLNLNITPSGLLKELNLPLSALAGVGTPEQLASLESVKLGALLNATLALVERGSGTAQAQVGLLADMVNVLLAVAPVNADIKLFGDGGLFDVDLATDAQAALLADIGVASILQTGLMIANGDNLIDLGLDVPLLGVTSKVRVVEPPAIRIGGVGTSASTAGIRVYLYADTGNIPFFGQVLGAMKTHVRLPLILEIGQSEAKLTSVCEAPLAPQQAVLKVKSSVANVCLGKFQNMSSIDDFFSADNACVEETFTSVQPFEILNVLGILPIKSHIALPVFREGQGVPVTLTAPPSEDSTATVAATNIDLTELSKDVADAVVAGVLGDLTGRKEEIPQDKAKDIAKGLVGSEGLGRSISDVINNLNWSTQEMNRLGERVKNGGLVGFLGSTLTVVGNVLDTVLGVTADTVCLLGMTTDNIRNCRINGVTTLGLTGTNAFSGLLNVVFALLQPLLDPLSLLVQKLLALLGVNLGEADVSLLSVDCGKPRLVY
ncbi:pilus assembly protein TadG-related protein [Bordetella sp. 02P26C-1]|uniref:pilus assembly protein TadG-related protein n=1 Tax=Bordetella sp. 02P26C-1 TaxID=2683195 RepID=UPI001354C455|nr:pilus assembly protein TadG-related protein [Bordetella sp. 02P26C-1]MVW79782.1 hypothetical protein [Bordetella sp. 02P26C-1]